MDGLAVKGRVHRADVRNVHALFLEIVQGRRILLRIALIPPQQGRGSDKKHKAGDDSPQGTAEALAITCLGNFLIGHNL